MSSVFGYPDWQRQSVFDSPPLIDREAQVVQQSDNLGPFFVGHWPRTAVNLRINNQVALWYFQWFADEALTKPLGSRRFVTHPDMAGHLFGDVPNLGPWLLVFYEVPLAAPAPVQTVHLYGTARQSPHEFYPEWAVLFQLAHVPIPGGTEVENFADTYFAGEGDLWVYCTQDASVFVRTWTDSVSQVATTEFLHIGASTDLRARIAIPAGPLQIGVQNHSGIAGEFFISLTPVL